jgi:hypothetical protein
MWNLGKKDMKAKGGILGKGSEIRNSGIIV